MSRFRLALSLVRTNFRSIATFEMLYKLFGALLFAPGVVWLVSISMRVAGYSFLTDANLGAFLRHPATIFLVLFVVLLSAMFTLLEMTSLTGCLHASYYGQRMTAYQMLRRGAQSARRVFYPRNWPMAVFVLFIVPMTNVAAASGYATSIRLPDTIREELKRHVPLLACCTLVLLLLYGYAAARMYAVHAFTLENEDFPAATRESVRILRRCTFRTVWRFVLFSISMVALELILTVLIGLAAVWFVRLFSGVKGAFALAVSLVGTVFVLVAVLFSVLATPVTFAFLSAQYYQDKRLVGETVAPFHPAPRPPVSGKRIAAAVACVLFLLAGLSLVTLVKNRLLISSVFDGTTVAAHRGDSFFAPENTLAAFENAIEAGADWIELDVQRAADGTLVVVHDEDLKRLTGEEGRVSEMTWPEIQARRVESGLYPAYADEGIPTLADALKQCRGRVRLIVELKGDAVGLAEAVAEEILRQDMQEDCVVMSSKYAQLVDVKDCAPEMQTAYVLTVAYGQLYDLRCADAFCVNTLSVTRTLVNQMHARGKRVFAWTVNSKKQIEDMLNLRIDVVISDHPARALEIASEASLAEGAAEAIRRVLTGR